MRHFPQEKSYPKKKKDRDEFNSIVEFIKANFTEDITVNGIAEKFYMSRKKLSLLFRKYSGLQITEYINTLRINKANLMLVQGSDITNAAFESGFQSLRTFNNTYKKQLGYTPSEYLKNKDNSQ